MTTCQTVREAIDRGEPEPLPPEQAAHLGTCDGCSSHLEARLEATPAAAGGGTDLLPVLSAVLPARRPWLARLTGPGRIPAAAFAALVMACFLILTTRWLLPHPGTGRWAPLSTLPRSHDFWNPYSHKSDPIFAPSAASAEFDRALARGLVSLQKLPAGKALMREIGRLLGDADPLARPWTANDLILAAITFHQDRPPGGESLERGVRELAEQIASRPPTREDRMAVVFMERILRPVVPRSGFYDGLEWREPSEKLPLVPRPRIRTPDPWSDIAGEATRGLDPADLLLVHRQYLGVARDPDPFRSPSAEVVYFRRHATTDFLPVGDRAPWFVYSVEHSARGCIDPSWYARGPLRRLLAGIRDKERWPEHLQVLRANLMGLAPGAWLALALLLVLTALRRSSTIARARLHAPAAPGPSALFGGLTLAMAVVFSSSYSGLLWIAGYEFQRLESWQTYTQRYWHNDAGGGLYVKSIGNVLYDIGTGVATALDGAVLSPWNALCLLAGLIASATLIQVLQSRMRPEACRSDGSGSMIDLVMPVLTVLLLGPPRAWGESLLAPLLFFTLLAAAALWRVRSMKYAREQRFAFRLFLVFSSLTLLDVFSSLQRDFNLVLDDYWAVHLLHAGLPLLVFPFVSGYLVGHLPEGAAGLSRFLVLACGLLVPGELALRGLVDVNQFFFLDDGVYGGQHPEAVQMAAGMAIGHLGLVVLALMALRMGARAAPEGAGAFADPAACEGRAVSWLRRLDPWLCRFGPCCVLVVAVAFLGWVELTVD